MATLPGLESIPLQPPRGETPIASYQPGMVQEAQEQQGQSVSRFGADVTQGAGDIADAQDRLAMSAAMDSFLGAKIQADQSATTDQDYATLPQRYHAQLQAAAQQAAAGITSPELRSEFQSRADEMSNWSADRVIGEAHVKAIDADRTSLDQFTSGIADKYAAATDDPTRAALLQNGQDAINAMAAKGSITEAERQAQSKFLAQTVTASRAKALVMTNPAQAATVLAPSGQTATGDPIYSQTGTWVDHLPPGQRAQLYDAAVHSVQNSQQAAEIDAERQQRLQDQADKQAADNAADKYVRQLAIDPSKVSATAIANDRSIPPSQWHTTLGLMQAASAANGETDTATKTYGPGFYDLYQRTMLPAGDPNRITDLTDLFSQVGPGKPLTIAGLDKLRTEMAGRGTPEGASAAKFQALALDRAKRELMWDEDLGGGYRVPDPHGADAFDHFQAQFFSYWDNGIKAGQTPAQLADLDTIDKMVAPLKRTPAQWVQDRLNADDSTLPPQAGNAAPDDSTLPPQAGNAAPKDPQIDLVPPAMNTRVAGTTTVLTPKGKFIWQADGWHPVAPPPASPPDLVASPPAMRTGVPGIGASAPGAQPAPPSGSASTTHAWEYAVPVLGDYLAVKKIVNAIRGNGDKP